MSITMKTEAGRPAILAGGSAFSPEQERYLEGFFAGVKATGISFADLAAEEKAANESAGLERSSRTVEAWTREERWKRDHPPLESIEQLMLDARANTAPAVDDAFRYKWNGLFWLNPVKDGYMCRLRIPGGVVRSHQLRELAAIARELTTGYLQITTRNNFQIRLIQPKDCPEVLRRIQACGLHSRGAGADNIRNITMNPAAGYDPAELIDVRPYVHELSTRILGSTEFYDLPRKFNIAYDGGGVTSSVEDTNDLGAQAIRVGENDLGLAPGVWFRLVLGGATGHRAFAADAGVIVAPEQLTQAMVALLRVFLTHGDRTDRKKARFKYVVDSLGLQAVIDEAEKRLPFRLQRLAPDASFQERRTCSQQGHSHVGVHEQKQPGLHWIGASVPVGQLTARQLERVADLADNHGSGEIRLTVWQNFLLPNVRTAYVPTVVRTLRNIGFPAEQTNLRSGFVACTGSRYCKFAATDTKGHALEAMAFLDRRLTLDRPINIHFTGCSHSCAQHFMGDIGLLGTKARGPSGQGYHIVVGGGFGENRMIGRQLLSAVPAESLGPTLESILRAYLARRQPDESFHQFCNRQSIGELQTAISEMTPGS